MCWSYKPVKEGRPKPLLLRHSTQEQLQDMLGANKKQRVMEVEDLRPQGGRQASAATATRWKGKGKSKAKGPSSPGDTSSQQLQQAPQQDVGEEEEEQEEGKEIADGEDEDEEMDFLDEAEGLFLECLLAQDIEDDDDDDIDDDHAAAAEKIQSLVPLGRRETPISRSTMDDILGAQYETADLNGAGGGGAGCSSMEESERIACALQEQEWLRPTPTPTPVAIVLPGPVAPAAGESRCPRNDSLPRTGTRRWGSISNGSVSAVRSSRTGLGQASQRGVAHRDEGSGITALPCGYGDGKRSPLSTGEKQNTAGNVEGLSAAAPGGSPAPCRRITRLSRGVGGDDGGSLVAAVVGYGGGGAADDDRTGVAGKAEVHGLTDCFCGLPLNEVPDVRVQGRR